MDRLQYAEEQCDASSEDTDPVSGSQVQNVIKNSDIPEVLEKLGPYANSFQTFEGLVSAIEQHDITGLHTLADGIAEIFNEDGGYTTQAGMISCIRALCDSTQSRFDTMCLWCHI